MAISSNVSSPKQEQPETATKTTSTTMTTTTTRRMNYLNAASSSLSSLKPNHHHHPLLLQQQQQQQQPVLSSPLYHSSHRYPYHHQQQQQKPQQQQQQEEKDLAAAHDHTSMSVASDHSSLWSWTSASTDRSRTSTHSKTPLQQHQQPMQPYMMPLLTDSSPTKKGRRHRRRSRAVKAKLEAAGRLSSSTAWTGAAGQQQQQQQQNHNNTKKKNNENNNENTNTTNTTNQPTNNNNKDSSAVRPRTPSPMSTTSSTASSSSSSSSSSGDSKSSFGSSSDAGGAPKVVRANLTPSAILERQLREIGCIMDEQSDDSLRRRQCLDALEQLLAQWAQTFAPPAGPEQRQEQQQQTNPKPAPPSYAAAAAAGVTTVKSAPSTLQPQQQQQVRPRISLVTFGSYRLGVHRPTSDLDVLAVAPPTITRNDFFSSLVTLLRHEQRQPSNPSLQLSEIHPIPSAYTPVIKFQMNGFQVDLLFARLADARKLIAFQQQQDLRLAATTNANPTAAWGPANNNSAPMTPLTPRMEYPIDDSDLLDQDEAGLRSLNGARVCQMLLERVPNLYNYRLVLCAVKHWAVVHGIYSNVLGFLGGINLAILVAWVCMKYPNASAATCLQHFFRTFALWKWPLPVLLGPIQQDPPSSVPGVPLVPAWNPAIHPRDGLHIMPIVTPAYPSMNSSYNVGIPQLRRMQDEMIRACNLMHRMMIGGPAAPTGAANTTTPADYDAVFRALFAPSDFFSRHEHFFASSHFDRRHNNGNRRVEQ